MRGNFVVAIAAAAWAGTAMAGVTGMYIGAVEGQTSIEMADGIWNQGDDWDYYVEPDGSADSWVNEHWISMNPLGLIGYVVTDEGTNLGGFNIDITKNITNESGFDWTGFDIVLSWDSDESSLDLIDSSVASDAFGDVTITDGPGDMVTMSFSDGLVPEGDSASFFFSFLIDGDINFKIDQIPIPEPTALALLALGGLFVARRR